MARYAAPDGWILQAYRYALDPTPRQEQQLRSHAGASRFAWNWGLARCQQRYAAERKWYSGVELHRLWNATKRADPALSWWGENSKCVYQEAFRDLDRALRDYIRSKKGERKGRRLGFPKVKKRAKCRDSFRFSTGVMRCTASAVTLPRLGTVATHESTCKLARRLEAGTAYVLSATVSRTAQRWYVCFQAEVRREIPARHPCTGSAVGVDLGIKTLLTGVDHRGAVVTVPGPQAFRASLRRLRRASRAHSRRAKGSANRRKAAARLARVHARAADVRADALHKATTELATRYETVVVEDLNVTGMLASRSLARAVADQGFGAFRRMLGYKTTWNGGQLIVADRWYPSSKTCSRCGWRKPSLTLKERVFCCQACGLVLDRDVNAAINLLKLAPGTASGAGTGPGDGAYACGAQVRPADGRLRALSQEPGVPNGNKTGTAAGQPVAAGARAH
jgi:putative transposase